TGVEISNGGTTFSSSVTLTPASGTVAATTISARISSTAAQQTATVNITDTSTCAPAHNVTVTGTVNAVTTPTVTVTPSTLSLGTTSAVTVVTAATFPLSGTNPFPTRRSSDLTGVEISNGGTTFSSSVTLTPTSGTVATTTISARISY